MYVGETSNPNHLIYELLDNALDESQGGHATVIGIQIDTKTGEVAVADNGRGIPFENDTIVTVCTKLFSGAKFDKGQGGVYKIACLVGNTKIKLIDGRDITIKEMAKNPNKDYWIISSTPDGKFVFDKAESPCISGYTNKLIRVYLDNGKYEDCTPEHLWMLRNGEYKKAEDLKPYDSLMPVYVNCDGQYITIRPNNSIDYERKIKFENRGYVELHRLLYENLYGKYEEDIHHIDFNRHNNYPENLKLLSKSDHTKIHSQYRSQHGLIDPSGLIAYSKSERGRNKSREVGFKFGVINLLKYVNSDGNKIDKSNKMKQFNKTHTPEYFITRKILSYTNTLKCNKIDINEENWNKYRPNSCPKFNRIFEYFSSIDHVLSLLETENISAEELHISKNVNIYRVIEILDALHLNSVAITKDNYEKYNKKYYPKYTAACRLFESEENLQKYFNENNHKVQKIEILNLDEYIPVYDFCAPKCNNFALSSGVIVHNSGLHGIGIVAVNALSEWLEVDVYRDKKHVHYKFVDAKVVDKKIENFEGTVPFSTQMKFKPDKKYFESLNFDIQSLRDRLHLASVHIDHLKLLLIIDGQRHIIDCDANDFFKDELLEKSSDKITQIFHLSYKVKDEEVSVRFCWDFEGSTTPKIVGSVNLLRVDAGTHTNYTLDSFRDIFFEIAEKEKRKITKNDCLIGLRCFTSIFLYEPQYNSQTKEKLTVPKKNLSHLFDQLASKFRVLLLQNDELRQMLLKHFETYRSKQNAKDNIIKSGKTITRLNSTIDSKLRDCTTHTISNSELFITEGTSAGTCLIQCRDPKIHAVLSLKGKIQNIADESKDFFKNKEIIEIINALGTGIEPEFDLESLRYGKIIIAPDGDPDGAHIATLLLTVFLKLVPKLIDKGVIYLAKMPLYGTMLDGKFIPLHSKDDADKYAQSHSNNVKIQRYKGLGEMNPPQLYVSLIDPNTRRILRIPSPKDPQSIFNLMTSAELKRKLV
jgi:DNA gyrase/topoisomerase IV subunit B